MGPPAYKSTQCVDLLAVRRRAFQGNALSRTTVTSKPRDLLKDRGQRFAKVHRRRNVEHARLESFQRVLQGIESPMLRRWRNQAWWAAAPPISTDRQGMEANVEYARVPLPRRPDRAGMLLVREGHRSTQHDEHLRLLRLGRSFHPAANFLREKLQV